MISNSIVVVQLTSFSTAVSIPDIKTIRPRARAMHKLRCIRIGFLFLGGFLQTNQNTIQRIILKTEIFMTTLFMNFMSLEHS